MMTDAFSYLMMTDAQSKHVVTKIKTVVFIIKLLTTLNKYIQNLS